MDINRQSRLRTALVVVSFFALSAVVYLPALQSFFHCDDFWLLHAVRRDGPFGVWSNPGSPFLRPIISLSLYLDWRLWGLHPFGYHAANVVAHTINALWVAAMFPLLMRVCGSSRNVSPLSGGAILSGLLFLLQPTHPEAVSWISGRTDVYATFFCLMALYFYLRHKGRSGHVWQKGAWALFALSLLSKESALLFPLVIVALEVFRLRALDKGMQLPKLLHEVFMNAWPFFGVVAVYMMLRILILGHLVGGYGAVHTTFNIGSLIQSAVWFLCSATLPLMPRWSYCFASLGLLATAFVLRSRGKVRPDPVLGFLFVAFYLSCAPVLNLGGGPAPDGMSGRLVYLASAFAALALVPLFDFLISNRRVSSAIPILLAGAFGVQLYLLNVIWLRAGQIAQECIEALASPVMKGPVVILAAPDTLYPAFVLRNGLPEAMRLFYPDVVSETEVVSSVFLYRPSDGVTIRSSNASESPGKRTLELLGPDPPGRTIPLGFTPGTLLGGEYKAELVSKTELQVILKDPADKRTQYFVFYKGRLSPLLSVSTVMSSES